MEIGDSRMTPERLAQIEQKLADLRVVGNTPGAHQERDDFLNVEVAELVEAVRDALTEDAPKKGKKK
jgi:hypothetical protein